MLVYDNAQAFSYEEKVSPQATDEVTGLTASVIPSECEESVFPPNRLRAVFISLYLPLAYK